MFLKSFVNEEQAFGEGHMRIGFDTAVIQSHKPGLSAFYSSIAHTCEAGIDS